jgi:CobQ-like glutamine amidotransferase family enzyme
MANIRILHLFDDAMSLYGEYANVLILERYLSEQGHSVQVDRLHLYEKRDISGYDFYFMGAGTERKQKLVLGEMRQYADALRSAYEGGKVMLFTGNSWELLGRSVTDAEGKCHDGLGIFPFETTEGNGRIVGDCLGSCDLFSAPIVGFMNKCSKTTGIANPLFRLKMGFGNDSQKGREGVQEKNLFATHLTGPVLVKNPALLKEIAKRLVGALDEGRMIPYLQESYETTAKALQNRLENMK